MTIKNLNLTNYSKLYSNYFAETSPSKPNTKQGYFNFLHFSINTDFYFVCRYSLFSSGDLWSGSACFHWQASRNG